MKIGTIILAAGDSSRMGGEPKQLLIYKGQSLMRRVTETALALQRGPIVVVLGANREQVVPELAGLPITMVDNSRWSSGQASSLKTGLAGLYLTHKDVDAVLVLHTDQPLVSVGLLVHMLDVWKEEDKGIVACRYDTQLSVPALFSRDYIAQLLQLEGDKGVKWVIGKHRNDCVEVPFEAGAIDLDSKRDVELFAQAQAFV
ncbi:nucleotidyltransferase family protein [Spirosoma utsteinense]|uniref:Molybdenum cofactor cytidylyltransferase n=1 Tax=Spirosoma utsteinense TaxID=2585773 RepID=A0ABR6W0D2_9BACT|nr:nucleotidyltransferase family protein [Spirosoma utsteinense]MBC3784598.1 molybdenum cofactor cytidylyltransferase [Spirosoma utsteinense]MBC3789649.1 molybdenum cofactor cytidylyltransferase [Spirosoma utsteinense]